MEDIAICQIQSVISKISTTYNLKANYARFKLCHFYCQKTTLEFCISNSKIIMVLVRPILFMANTYTQLLIQLVIVVKHRKNLINERVREQVEKYICGIISYHQCKPLAIYCNPDHCHILIGLHPSKSIADLMREVKSSSTNYINQNKLTHTKFTWQVGYGAFSYNRSILDRVVKYILNQREHHRKVTFKEEYVQFLEKFEIDYEERFLFDFI